MEKRFLAEMRPKEAAEAFKRTDIALIPSGAIHPHGAAVPIGYDFLMAQELANRISKRTDVIVLPVIPHGYTEYHGDFPGNISISRSTWRAMLLEICEWLHKWGIKKVVHINCHGGDEPTIQEVAYHCRYKWNMLSASLAWNVVQHLMPEVRKYWDPPGEGLTNNISLMLHLRPDLVNMSEETYKKEKQLFGDRFEARALTEVRFKGVPIRVYISNRDLTDTSGYGPHIDKVNYVKESSAELGERMLTTAVDFIVEFIDEFRKVKIPPL